MKTTEKGEEFFTDFGKDCTRTVNQAAKLTGVVVDYDPYSGYAFIDTPLGPNLCISIDVGHSGEGETYCIYNTDGSGDVSHSIDDVDEFIEDIKEEIFDVAGFEGAFFLGKFRAFVNAMENL